RVLPRRRRMVETEDLDRCAGPCLLDLLATVVVEGAHPAPGIPGAGRVADPEGAALNEHGRNGAAAHVEPRLDDRTGGLGLRIRLQLELGIRYEQHLLEQLVEVLLRLRRNVRELDLPAPVLGLQTLACEITADAVRVGVR